MWRLFAPELRRRRADLHAAASAAELVRAALLDTLPPSGHCRRLVQSEISHLSISSL